ncbi:MAG: hypothetical protein QM627_11985 [Luteolibacter sp.]
MKRFPLLVPAVLIPWLVSCDQARKLASEAESRLGRVVNPGKAETPAPPPADEPDPALLALVDQTPEGVIFRKDLPFPEKLTIRTQRTLTYSNAREVRNSMIERNATRVDGTVSQHFTCTREGENYTFENASTPPSSGEGTVSPAPTANTGKSIRLTRKGGSWTAAKVTDFTNHVLTQETLPLATAFFTEAGALPRTLWFGKRRLKPGDSITLDQSQLPMLQAFPGSGTLHLIFQKMESVHGHPCGVFSISGNYTAKQILHPDGEKSGLDLTITSGNIWLSLLYPVVLKQELETVQTLTRPHSHLEGGVRVSIDRQWKAIE